MFTMMGPVEDIFEEETKKGIVQSCALKSLLLGKKNETQNGLQVLQP